MRWETNVAMGKDTVAVLVKLAGHPAVDIQITTEEVAGLQETYLLRVRLTPATDAEYHIETIAFSWATPAIDMHGMYFGGDPRFELGYLPFHRQTQAVCANTGVPYLALVHRNGRNRAAYGLLDQQTEMAMHSELSELTRAFHLRFEKPVGAADSRPRIPVRGPWEEALFISRADVEWPTVLQRYARLATAQRAQEVMPVPPAAFDPVFCTWTAIHHEVSHAWIMANAARAAELGFRTWLTDDGWFLENGCFGDYAEVGEWMPSRAKFPDFRDHVAAVKALGFRYVLWVAPFMIGTQSAKSRAYAHLLTTGQEREQFRNLSPWHDATAQIVTQLLQRLVTDYDLDGMKIDFIDAVSVYSERIAGANDKTLGANMANILHMAVTNLLTLKPDFLIEFRNRYANLASRSYANIYRSSDVPINFTLNRWQAVMLRLLAPDRAVHTDPMLWHPEDSDENVAVHLINGIATVPMVSIDLVQYPQRHLELIRHWICFYNEHRDTIIRGTFRPQLRGNHVPLIEFVGEEEVIIGLYDDVGVRVKDATKTHWILNASTQDAIDLAVVPGGKARVSERSRFGESVSVTEYDQLPAKLAVEIGGSLEIKFLG